MNRHSNIYVLKADGRQEQFAEWKVKRTCKMMGASEHDAKLIAEKIRKMVYNGIKTDEILNLTLRLLESRLPFVKYVIDLRKAISLIKPKPDFEIYVRAILEKQGYKVYPSQVIRGLCVDHEVDGIAVKDNSTSLIEIKHHKEYHTLTGLDVPRIAWAVLEDIKEGYNSGLNNVNPDSVIIICNTKYSEHAKRYCRCKGMRYIGWSSPKEFDLQTMIIKNRLYPITYLRTLSAAERESFSTANIVLLKQLLTRDVKSLSDKVGINVERLEELIGQAKAVLNINSESES